MLSVVVVGTFKVFHSSRVSLTTQGDSPTSVPKRIWGVAHRLSSEREVKRFAISRATFIRKSDHMARRIQVKRLSKLKIIYIYIVIKFCG